MKHEFWLERWERNETGFHQNEINPYLQQFWPQLCVPGGTPVFVPLCGKSKDMLWLSQQGHPVLGVELSQIAIRSFFDENNLTPVMVSDERYQISECNNIRILCGDFFALTPSDMTEVGAVYDRASLVALPPSMRAEYAHHMATILPAGSKILLLTFDYPQHEMSGPPFAVTPEEVVSLYGSYADICKVAELDTLALTPRFQQRGLTRLTENVFILTIRE